MLETRKPRTLASMFNDASPDGGILVSMISVADADRMISKDNLSLSDFDQCASINRKSCAAWSYFRRDLPPMAFIVPGIQPESIGVILDPRKARPLITGMSIIDGDTDSRSCCSNETGQAVITSYNTDADSAYSRCVNKAFEKRFPNSAAAVIYVDSDDRGASCPASCPEGDERCRMNNSGGSINTWDMMDWPECAAGAFDNCFEFLPVQSDDVPPEVAAAMAQQRVSSAYRQTTPAGCRVCTKPFLCVPEETPTGGRDLQIEDARIAAYVGEEGEKWMSMFAGSQPLSPTTIGSIAVRQCKFHPKDWATWVKVLKEFYARLLANPLISDPAAPLYLENEVNMYIDPNPDSQQYSRQNKIFQDSIIGIFYIRSTCEEQMAPQPNAAALCDKYFQTNAAARHAAEQRTLEHSKAKARALVDVFRAQGHPRVKLYSAALSSNTFTNAAVLSAARAGKIDARDLFAEDY